MRPFIFYLFWLWMGMVVVFNLTSRAESVPGVIDNQSGMLGTLLARALTVDTANSYIPGDSSHRQMTLSAENSTIPGVAITLVQSAPAQKGNASISGTVTNSAQESAPILVRVVRTSDNFLGAQIELPETGGAYRLDSLTYDAFIVEAVLDRDRNHNAGPNDWYVCYQQNVEDTGCTVIPLAENQHVTAINLEFKEFAPPGEPIGSISGYVRNETDRNGPIIVRLWGPSQQSRNLDANHYYQFDSLLTGIYIVDAFIDENNNQIHDTSEFLACYMQDSANNQCSEVSISEAEPNHADISFKFQHYLKPVGTSSIRGRVFWDSTAQFPLYVAAECLECPGWEGLLKGARPGSAGFYLLDSLPAGNYEVFSWSDLDADKEIDENEPEFCYQRDYSDTNCVIIHLADGQTVTNINIYHGIVPPAATPYGCIEGVVQNLTGQDGFLAVMAEHTTDSTRNRWVPVSNHDGSYRMDSLRPGGYQVFAGLYSGNDPDTDSLRVENCFYELSNQEQCRELMVSAGDTLRGINIRLKVDSTTVGGASAQGTVRLNRTTSWPVYVVLYNFIDFFKQQLTGSDYSFRFEGLNPGQYIVFAYLDTTGNHFPDSIEPGFYYDANRDGARDTLTIIRRDESLTQIDIEMRLPLFTLRGMIQSPWSFSPPAWVGCSLDSSLLSPFKQFSKAADDNRYSLEIVSPGAYYFKAIIDSNNNQNFEGSDYLSKLDRDNDQVIDSLIVAGPRPDFYFDFTRWQRLSSALEQTGEIRGRVVYRFPYSWASYPLTTTVTAINAQSDRFEARTDNSGNFRLNLPAGTYRVAASGSENYFETWYDSVSDIRTAIPISVTKNQIADSIVIFPLPKPHLYNRSVVMGQAVDDISGEFLVNCRALLSRDTLLIQAISDTLGIFRFTRLASGSYSLTVEKEGYLPYKHATPLNLGPADTIRSLRVELQGESSDTVGPVITPLWPEANQINAPLNGQVVLRVEDSLSGIDTAMTQVWVDGIRHSLEYQRTAQGYMLRVIHGELWESGVIKVVSVAAADWRGNYSRLNYGFKTVADTVAPALVSPIRIIDRGADFLQLEWETNEPSAVTVMIQPYHALDSLFFQDTTWQTHFQWVLRGLTPATFYRITVALSDRYHNQRVYLRDSVATAASADTTSPAFVSGPVVPYIGVHEALIEWQSSKKTTAQIFWNVTAGPTQFTKIDSNFSYNHRVMLDSLIDSTAYTGQIILFDNQGKTFTGAPFSFHTRSEEAEYAPSIVEGPLVANITAQEAVLLIQTDRPAVSRIYFGTDTLCILMREITQPTLEHRYVLSGLTPNTLYYYRWFLANPANNAFITIKNRFRTLGDSLPVEDLRLIYQLSSNPTSQGIRLVWQTQRPARADVVLAPGADTSNWRCYSVSESKLKHELRLNNLLSNTKYYYRITAIDAAGLQAAGYIDSFMTLAASDTIPPLITAGPRLQVYDRQFFIEFLTDEESLPAFYYWDKNQPAITNSVSAKEFSKSHRLIVSDLNPGVEYEYFLEVTDIAGNKLRYPQAFSLSKKIPVTGLWRLPLDGWPSFTTNTSSDTQAPVITEGPSIYERGDHYISLYFKTNEPAMASVAWGKSLDNPSIQSSDDYATEHLITIYDLENSQEYFFTIVCSDINQNQGVFDDRILRSTTLQQPDQLTPRLLKPPTISSLSSEMAILHGSTNKPTLTLVSLYDAANLLQTQDNLLRSIQHYIIFSGLQSNRAYHFQNSVSDVDGRWSDIVEGEFQTGSSSDQAPPVIDSIALVDGLDFIQVYLQTDELTTAYVDYSDLTENYPYTVSDIDLI